MRRFTIKQYDANGKWFIVNEDGNTECNKGFSFIVQAEFWLIENRWGVEYTTQIEAYQERALIV